MFELVPFQAAHVLPILAEENNAHWREKYETPGLTAWLESQCSFTGLLQGKPVVCGGITLYWPGRGHVWTIFSEISRNNFVPVFRGMRKFLREQLKTNFHRIEVSVPCDFQIGRRRAELLGFRLETGYAEGYLPNGGDAAVYVMTKRGG